MLTCIKQNTMGQREKEEWSIYQYSVEEGISSGVPSHPEPHQVTTQLPAERESERERERERGLQTERLLSTQTWSSRQGGVACLARQHEQINKTDTLCMCMCSVCDVEG